VQIAAFLEKMDMVVAPFQLEVMAHGDHHDIAQWMSPLKLFEYMAAGRAIISSDLPVIREVLQDGRNALLCAPSDVEEWVRSITSLNRDAHVRETLGAAARKDFEEHYTWANRARGVLRPLFDSDDVPTNV
jgi:glycosyltransferase involved in cell wall biosynthesis